MFKCSNKRIFFIYMMMLCIGIIISICALSQVNNKNLLYEDYSKNWVDKNNNKINIKKIEHNSVISKEISSLDEDKLLFMSLKNSFITIYVDNEIIYQTTHDYNESFGKGSGEYYINVLLKREYSNKKLSIKFDNPYGEKTLVTDIRIGAGYDIAINTIKSKYISSSLCMAILIIGVVLLILFLIMHRKKIVGTEMLYLGFFSILLGAFTLFDSRILQLLYGSEYIFHSLSEVYMLLLMIPALLYIDKEYNINKTKTPVYLCKLSMIVFVVSILLNNFKIYDYHEIVILTHITYILTIIYIAYLIIYHLVNRTNKVKSLLGLIFVCLCALIDLFILYFCHIGETTFFTRIGTICFLIYELAINIYEHINNYKEDFKMQMLSKLAYHDGLTNLLNRTSFDEDMELLSDSKENKYIVMFDVNDLKKINDLYGHSLGDSLILVSSETLTKFFGNLGKVYRIGGDEFVVLIEGLKDEQELKKAISDMNEYLKNGEYNFPFKIVIASGYAKYSKRKHISLVDTFKEADIKMYKNKRKIKGVRKHEK